MENDEPQQRTHKLFLLLNYIMIGSASSCIFLTLSLRLTPSLFGFLFILLHIFTISTAILGCLSSSLSCYAAHMVAAVLASIFQGSISVLIFTSSGDFLASLKSIVREGDGVVIVSLAAALCGLIFFLEWGVIVLGFFFKYDSCADGDLMKRSGKVRNQEDAKDWPWAFQL